MRGLRGVWRRREIMLVSVCKREGENGQGWISRTDLVLYRLLLLPLCCGGQRLAYIWRSGSFSLSLSSLRLRSVLTDLSRRFFP